MYQLKELKDYIENVYAGHLLDVATGEGDFLQFLLDNLSSYDSATGIDTSKESLSVAKNRLAPYKIDFLQGHVRKLPFEDNYFDFVSVSNGLHHFDQPVKSIQSMMRVLVSGGRILINETITDNLNAAQNSHYLYHTLKTEIDTAKGNYHHINYSKEELYEIFNNADIDVETEIICSEEPSILSSKEKIWQFSRTIDEMIQLTQNLPLRDEYELRGIDLKERIVRDGFQFPPQMAVIAYKL